MSRLPTCLLALAWPLSCLGGCSDDRDGVYGGLAHIAQGVVPREGSFGDALWR